MSGEIIFGLDIGSSKIVALVGSLGPSVNILGFSSHHFTSNSRNNDYTMLSNGLICEIERVGHKITQAIREAQIHADCSSGSLIVNISGNHLRNIYSHSRQELNGHVVSEDIIRYMINEAKQAGIPNSYEVIDYEVQEYLIDDNRYAINPLELNCQSINSNVNLFIASKTPLLNLRKAISYSSYDIAKIVPSAWLSALAVLNDDERELGCCLLDIGAGTTDLVVYENGFIRHLATIPLGSEDITRDIASVLRISRNLAEDLKLTHGACVHNARHLADGINLIDHRGENIAVARKLLQDVIIERIKDIFGIVKTQLNDNKLYDIINSGIVLTGAGANLTGLKEFAGDFFELPVRIGVPNYQGDFAEIVSNPKYATVLGSLYFANEVLLAEDIRGEQDRSMELSSIFKKIKGIFRNI